mmetsp:Transcript_87237/g.241974  ORF Transcript_87237/g.241974 Transcript_87237/m.241974 type:complete len:242 (-) Transcript_87237:401-1126(-)
MALFVDLQLKVALVGQCHRLCLCWGLPRGREPEVAAFLQLLHDLGLALSDLLDDPRSSGEDWLQVRLAFVDLVKDPFKRQARLQLLDLLHERCEVDVGLHRSRLHLSLELADPLDHRVVLRLAQLGRQVVLGLADRVGDDREVDEGLGPSELLELTDLLEHRRKVNLTLDPLDLLRQLGRGRLALLYLSEHRRKIDLRLDPADLGQHLRGVHALTHCPDLFRDLRDVLPQLSQHCRDLVDL